MYNTAPSHMCHDSTTCLHSSLPHNRTDASNDLPQKYGKNLIREKKIIAALFKQVCAWCVWVRETKRVSEYVGACVHLYLRVCMCVRVHVCTCECVCVCVYVCQQFDIHKKKKHAHTLSPSFTHTAIYAHMHKRDL